MKIINILNNFFKNKNYLVILKKLLKRLEKDESDSAVLWAKNEGNKTVEEWMQDDDLNLYLETTKECKKLKDDAEKILSNINENLSGGAAYELLYFLTKKIKPQIIVETGVAAGWSSLAFLRASRDLENLKIFSSDFPLFRNKNPENHIGIITKKEPNLEKLNLFIEGDEKNIPLIIKKLENKKIDLFHFDSDKSYSGRDFCVKILENHFSKKAILIFDDIYNNFHFRDYVKKNDLKYSVLKYKTGFIGLVDLGKQR